MLPQICIPEISVVNKSDNLCLKGLTVPLVKHLSLCYEQGANFVPNGAPGLLQADALLHLEPKHSLVFYCSGAHAVDPSTVTGKMILPLLHSN